LGDLAIGINGIGKLIHAAIRQRLLAQPSRGCIVNIGHDDGVPWIFDGQHAAKAIIRVLRDPAIDVGHMSQPTGVRRTVVGIRDRATQIVSAWVIWWPASGVYPECSRRTQDERERRDRNDAPLWFFSPFLDCTKLILSLESVEGSKSFIKDAFLPLLLRRRGAFLYRRSRFNLLVGDYESITENNPSLGESSDVGFVGHDNNCDALTVEVGEQRHDLLAG
jgi:hypothetical protein